jgi:glyoxylase-like metal-dependent hydrolase (beta-lactamase superfamily II)
VVKHLLTTGSMEIWRIIDNETNGCIHTDTFPRITKNDISMNANWLSPNYLDKDANFVMSMQSFLVRIGNRILVIDGAIGNDKLRYAPWANRAKTEYLRRLHDAGFCEEDISYVLATHMHMDHVGWFTKWTKNKWVPTFPNAKYIFVREEYDYWKRSNAAENVDTCISLIDSVDPVIYHNQAEYVSHDYIMNEEIHYEAAPGHTPGQIIVHVRHGQSHVIVAGDIFHHPIQISDPNITADHYDVDVDRAKQTRISFLRKYANTGAFVIGLHFAAMPIGIIEESKGKTIFQPA